MKRYLAPLALLLCAWRAGADDWPSWRGPTGLGVSRSKSAPLEWDKTKNVKWKVALPAPGNSTPIVWGDIVFVTSAVESVDDRILGYLDKHHTRADFERVLMLCRVNGISLAPTFVPFTPWTTLDGYLDLLRELARLNLQEAVPPVQLAIRLLVPQGSYLLHLPGFAEILEPFDPKLLGYPWRHADASVDALQHEA